MIVALDAASTDLSLALADPDGAIMDEDAWSSSQRQSAELLPRLLELLARNDRGLDGVSAIGVGTGPGSFTGLRVGMALAKGLAFSLGLPIVGVPSLGAWLAAEPEAKGAIARAGAHEAYILLRDGAGPAIARDDELAQRTRGHQIVAPAELVVAFGLEDAVRPRGARAMAAATAERLAGEASGDDLGTLEPIYLRAPRGVTAETEGRVRWL